VRVVSVPGDGIGPEVMREAVAALAVVASDVVVEEHPLGAAAIEALGDPLPVSTLEACLASEAVLMGAVGANHAWQEKLNPEEGMFRLRRELDVYANLRPFAHGDVDLMIVRELVGGLYFGARGTRADGTVYDTCEYHPAQVERVLRRGFEIAAARRGRLTSVDKANVLATSRMWRATADRLAAEYPDVTLEHLLVDTAALHLVRDPGRFDVIVTENTFGDILSDVAAAVAGGLETAASASIGDRRPGLFEPVHGTAPDIAGSGRANPAAMLLSAALMLRYGLGRDDEARTLETAVHQTSAAIRDGQTLSTRQFGDAVVERLQRASDNLTNGRRTLERRANGDQPAPGTAPSEEGAINE
jgi:3-isopropylmalate dehydrogenase